MEEKLAQFRYSYTHGPLDTEAELRSGFSTGNCRRALQDFVHKRHGRFLAPEEIYIPESYDSFGHFVVPETEAFSLEPLRTGDVVYAQRVRTKTGRVLELGPDMYDSRDEWLFSLHNAVFLGELTEELKQFLPDDIVFAEGVAYVWHATVISGGTALWDWETFLRYYAPVSAKRLV